MRLRLKDTLGYMSLVAVYSSTDMCEAGEKMYYAKLDSVLEQCPRRDTLIVLGDFNAATGTESVSVVQWLAHLATNPLARVRTRTRTVGAQLIQLFILPNWLVDK